MSDFGKQKQETLSKHAILLTHESFLQTICWLGTLQPFCLAIFPEGPLHIVWPALVQGLGFEANCYGTSWARSRRERKAKAYLVRGGFGGALYYSHI